MTRHREDGQVLVLFALILTLLIGISALVVDIGVKYSTERRYQAIADAASLAGAQELQPDTRTTPVTPAMQEKARVAALRAISNELLPGVTPTCPDDGTGSPDWTDCDLLDGQYNVSIITPSPVCVDCDVDRAVQVTVTEPEHQTGFARLFGQTTWNLSRTSVAGLSFGKSYAVIALQPPRIGGPADSRNMKLDGGMTIRVINGDVGTNSNMKYDGAGALLRLDTGYDMYFYDPSRVPLWGSTPVGKPIRSPILDPEYPVTFSNDTANATQDTPANCQLIVETFVAKDVDYAKLVPTPPSFKDGPKGVKQNVRCWKPGAYTSITDNSGMLTILEPGLYSFADQLNVQSNLIGGYDPSQVGVSLVFTASAQFINSNGVIALNAGTRFPFGAGGEEPETAPLMTPTTTPLKMTVSVLKDGCDVVLPYPLVCDDNHHNSITLTGGGALYLGGVQYAPSDNVKIAGNSSAEGYVGQVIAWTLDYNGSKTVLNQEGFGVDGPGRIRIDTACSPGDDTHCN